MYVIKTWHIVQVLIKVAPFLDRVDIPYNKIRINGSLANESGSIFRQPPSPEVDAAWDRISLIGFHTISGSDIEKLERDPSKSVEVPLDWGHGPHAYLALPDTFHLIHCLNVLRKRMYPNYYTERRVMEDVHPSHCLDVILQNLMCDSSLDVITYTWRQTQVHPWPEMSVNKKCRDFDTVLDWHTKTSVADPIMKAMRKPKDVLELPLSKTLLDLINDSSKND